LARLPFVGLESPSTCNEPPLDSDSDCADRGIAESGVSIPQAGGLRRCLSWWQLNCKSSWVRQWAAHGVPLWWADRQQPATPFSQPNHEGAFNHRDFVSQNISELLQQGAITKVPLAPRVVNPLNVVPKKGGKLRLILDLRHVNKFLSVPKFKIESLSALESLAARGDLMFACDLLSGYYQCEMHEDAWTYLGFQWEGSYYVFRVLPFGLASAPWAFTKMMREVAAPLRAKGVKLLVYLDDWLCLVPGADLARARTIRSLVLNTLRAAGLTLNKDKSHLEFTANLQHLGFVIDLERGCFIVPECRWVKLQGLVTEVLQKKKVTVRTLSRISGHIVSMHRALGRVSRLFTRVSYRYQANRSPNFHIIVGDDLREELSFWKERDREEFTTLIWREASIASVKVQHLATDAGAEAWGAVFGEERAHGFFPDTIRSTSSTHREMLAALFALYAFKAPFHGKHVQLQTDNQAVPLIISNGSSRWNLNALALEIFWFCQKFSVSLSTVWVPRAQNTEADAMTRWNDTNDWMLDPSLFAVIDSRWGPFTCDRFAGHSNYAQLPYFNSLFWCPDTGGLNAFAQTDWAEHNNWCYAPFDLIPRVLAMVREHKAKATLVVPYWPSRPWWPLIVPSLGWFCAEVVECFELPPSHDLFLSGKRSGNSVGVGNPRWRVFAVRLDGSGRGRCATPF